MNTTQETQMKPLSELASTLQLLTWQNQSDEVGEMAYYFRRLINKVGEHFTAVTGFTTNVADGDYTEVWFTSDNAPYLNTATYTRIV